MNEHEFNVEMQKISVQENDIVVVYYEIGQLSPEDATIRIKNFIDDINKRFPSLFENRLVICPMRMGKKAVEFEPISTSINKLIVYCRTYNTSKVEFEQYCESMKTDIETTHPDLRDKLIMLPIGSSVEVEDA